MIFVCVQLFEQHQFFTQLEQDYVCHAFYGGDDDVFYDVYAFCDDVYVYQVWHAIELILKDFYVYDVFFYSFIELIERNWGHHTPLYPSFFVRKIFRIFDYFISCIHNHQESITQLVFSPMIDQYS